MRISLIKSGGCLFFTKLNLQFVQPRDRSLHPVIQDRQSLLRLAVPIEEEDPAVLKATGALVDMEPL